MSLTEIIFLFLIATVAFFYSTVGHGGASGYLALMALFSFAPHTMRSTALILNLFVSLIAFILYFQKGYFQKKIFLPLIVGSVPASFLGGTLFIESGLYKKMLSVLLLIPAIKLSGYKIDFTINRKEAGTVVLIILGIAIGFLSGLIGIGGGIILSPVLLFMKWTDLKQTAAISSLFIFCNSLAGLIGLSTVGFEYEKNMPYLIFSALVGGLLGSYLGSSRFKNPALSKILSIVLLIASLKLMFA